MRSAEQDLGKLRLIDVGSFFSNINNMSVFQNKSVLGQVKVLQNIFLQLQAQEADGKLDIKDLWRVGLTLTEKTCEPIADENDQKAKVITKSLFSKIWEDPATRDVMLKIGRLYPRFTIFTEFASQDTFASALKKLTPTLTQELNNCFHDTSKTRMIAQSDWPQDLDFQTNMVESSDIPLNYLEN